MNPSYQKLLEIAQSKKKDNKKFLDRLKKKKPFDLDEVTHRLHDKSFEHINCLECANCCRTIGPRVTNRDIENLSKHFRVKPSEFTNQYLRVDEDGDHVFKKMPCVFIDENNYCTVYSHRPAACREYPHTQQKQVIKKLSITYQNSMICPAVAEVVEGLKRVYNV